MKRLSMSLLLATTSSLLWLYLAPSASAAELLAPIVMRAPPGWQADEEGYFLNAAALQYLVADAESWEKTAAAWEEAYSELSDRYQAYIQESREKFQRLHEEVESEREQWKKKIRQERSRPGVGIFGGYGVGGATLGIGIVWRVM